MAKSNKRPLAVFQFKKYRKIQDFIGKVRAIVLSIGNASGIFTTPVPTLLSVGGHVDDLEDAQAVADTRVAGAVGQRDIKYGIVLNDIYDLTAYVQNIADNAGGEVEAIAVITASGFSVRLNGKFIKPELSAKNGVLTGTVELVAKGGKPRETHEWQISANNINWSNLTPTLKAKTMVTGLTRLTTQYFRHRLITKTGPAEWSQVVNIVVL